METRLGLGADVHSFQSSEKECTANECSNPGWKRNDPLFAVSAYGTADWRWVGLSFGGVLPLHERRGGRLEYDIVSAWIPLEYFPQGSLRLGPSDLLYATLEMGTGHPFRSGWGFPYGVGGRLLETDLWIGAEEWSINTGLSASVARSFGPVRVRFATSLSRGVDSDSMDSDDPADDIRVDIPQHSLSAGIDYHLPW